MESITWRRLATRADGRGTRNRRRHTQVGRLYVDLTICWELLSGLYYQEFEAMLDASDVAIHRPSRTNEGTDWAYTTDGEPATPTACRETYDGGSTYKGRGNCGVPHYVYGETGKVLTKKDVTGEETDERYAAADQFLLEEGARSSFLTILAHDLMEENKIEMPLNMPFTTLPPSKARSRRPVRCLRLVSRNDGRGWLFERF